MNRQRQKPPPGGAGRTKRTPKQRPKGLSEGKTAGAPGEPEEEARAVVAHAPLATPSGDKVKLTLTVSLSRAQAERLTTWAIREGKNLEALVAEILEGEAGDVRGP